MLVIGARAAGLPGARRAARCRRWRPIRRTATAAGLRLPDSEAELVIQTERQGPETDLAVDSADESVRFMEQAGGRIIVPPFDIQIGRCAVVEDPWGNVLVLLDGSKGLLKTDAEGNVIGNVKP